MGSSYTEYRGCGFWARDVQVEVWLHLLARQADAVAHPPAWLDAACEDWRLQATAGFNGAVSAGLDDHLGCDAERVRVVRELSAEVRARLVRWSPAIPRDVANGFGIGGAGVSFRRDLGTELLLKFADMFTGLLDGEVPSGSYDIWAR
jgi:hypothetical protein